MAQSIVELVDNLYTDNITVNVLKTISTFTPGKWENLVGFDNTITAVTGATSADKISDIRDPKATRSVIADKIGDKFSFIPFLDKITPKADSVQSVDLRIKLVAELIVFSKLNDISLNPSKFVGALKENYQKEALLRMASLVCIDGILPLGVNFVSRVKQDSEQRDNL